MKTSIMGRLRFNALILLLLPISLNAAAQSAPAKETPSTSFPKVLTASEAGAILPTSVFFRGQSASIQARNSGGIQFSKDALLLATLVDTSGYSSSVHEKYQAYLITEVPIDFGGHRLGPGAYGCGVIAGDNFIVMDIGGHDLFTVKSAHDAEIRRPTPLQILTVSGDKDRYRLYEGRSYVEFTEVH
jgi:hypothetical protein